jgi:hypothetical protein
VSAEPLLAELLTQRIAATTGVRRIFPQPGVLTTVAALVPLPIGGPAGAVRVERTGDGIEVRARLATDVGVPAVQVVAAVRQVVADALGGERFRVRLQLCQID